MNSKNLHIRNIHNKSYDLEKLSEVSDGLKKYIKTSSSSHLTIDFSNASALLELNKALLLHHYQINDWTISDGHLCPPIPGRADYIHHIADLIRPTDTADIPVGKTIKGLDIGTGAGCIYPLLGNSIYGWRFVGTDIDSDSINSSKAILSKNAKHKKNIRLRFQKTNKNIFKNILNRDEIFDFSMCNPPFYSSIEEANQHSIQKKSNLKINKEKLRSFGGKNAELWCKGGELGFIKLMIKESVEIQNQCRWFTTLISNKENIKELRESLSKRNVEQIRVIEMKTGNKVSHILAWSYL